MPIQRNGCADLGKLRHAVPRPQPSNPAQACHGCLIVPVAGRNISPLWTASATGNAAAAVGRSLPGPTEGSPPVRAASPDTRLLSPQNRGLKVVDTARHGRQRCGDQRSQQHHTRLIRHRVNHDRIGRHSWHHESISLHTGEVPIPRSRHIHHGLSCYRMCRAWQRSQTQVLTQLPGTVGDLRAVRFRQRCWIWPVHPMDVPSGRTSSQPRTIVAMAAAARELLKRHNRPAPLHHAIDPRHRYGSNSHRLAHPVHIDIESPTTLNDAA